MPKPHLDWQAQLTNPKLPNILALGGEERAFVDEAVAEINGQITFDARGAEYDSFYKEHWRITDRQGFMVFGFHGSRPFTFHALGSTANGKSHCFLNVYVNGELLWERRFIEQNWDDYTIPAQAFAPGENTVRLELVGATQLWIDEARVGMMTEEGGEGNSIPEPRGRRVKR